MKPSDYPPGIAELFHTPGTDWEAAKDAVAFVAACLTIAVLAGLA